MILDCDASDNSIGRVLSQIVDGQERVVAYASQALTKSHRNYLTTYKELLAVVRMAKVFRPYIYGHAKVLLRTDHRAFLWLQNFKDIEGMLARWLTSLAEYNFTIEYRPGKQHGNADGCSRIPIRACKREGCLDDRHEAKSEAVMALTRWNESRADQFLKSWELCKSAPVLPEASVVAPVAADEPAAEPETRTDARGEEPAPGSVRLAPPAVHPCPNWMDSWSTEKIVEVQAQDSGCAKAIEWIKAVRPKYCEIASSSDYVKDIWAQFGCLKLEDNKLCRT